MKEKPWETGMESKLGQLLNICFHVSVAASVYIVATYT